MLYDSDTADYAVTFMWDKGKFHAAAELGDIVFVQCKVIELRDRAIKFICRAEYERDSTERTLIASGEFVWVAKKGDDFVPHELEL
jgi:acyl-CoA hydrolase